jgi:pilus assembly protein CpaC
MTRVALIAALMVAALAGVASAAAERIRIPVGRGEVIQSPDEVKTVAIAEPKIADAAVGSQRTVVVNAKSPGVTTLVVYGEGARFKVYEIESYVPGSENLIALHCNVSELSDAAERQLGFDYLFDVTSTVPWLDGNLSGGLFIEKTAAGVRDGVLAYTRTAGDLFLSTQWKALESTGDIRTLANPTVVARSGEQATFLSGGQFPVPIATGGGTGTGTAIVQSVTIEWKEFGIRLNMKPTMLEDGTMHLVVEPEVSALDFSTPLKVSGFEVPIINTNKTATTVILKPGEHLMVGGLKYQKSAKVVSKIPILGDIPLLGFFFSSTHTKIESRNLLITISPETIAASANAIPNLSDGKVPGIYDPDQK